MSRSLPTEGSGSWSWIHWMQLLFCRNYSSLLTSPAETCQKFTSLNIVSVATPEWVVSHDLCM